MAAIDDERGRLDVLVNDIFGGDRYMQWDKPLWEHDWQGGPRMLRMGVHTHLITCRAAIPVMLRTAASHGTRGLVVEMTDGTSQANAEFRRNVGFYYDLVKANVERIVKGLAAELEHLPVTAVGVTPGWLRSEMMLENFGVTEASWRDACVRTPGFAISESPAYVARGIAALAAAGLVSLAEPEPLIGMVRRSQPIAFTRSPAEHGPTERYVHISHERAPPRKRLVKACTERFRGDVAHVAAGAITTWTGRVSRPEPDRAVRRTGKARGTSTARAAGDTVVPASGAKFQRAAMEARMRVASASPNSSSMHLVAPAPKGR